MSKIWFITGTSKGFGREFARAALQRGDKVAATARTVGTLAELAHTFGDAVLPLALDVTDRAQVFDTVAAARARFGRIDVVVNNAGYGLFGAVEEITDRQLRDQLDTNLFGPLHVTQATLPVLREQGGGHIIQVTSVGGVITFPNLGAYHASKWALEALTESLAAEVAGQGIKVTLIEPGGFATDWAGASATFAAPLPQYDGIRTAMTEMAAGIHIPEPLGFGPAILELVDAEKPPLRVFFGQLPGQLVPPVYQQRLQEWADWAHLSRTAEGT